MKNKIVLIMLALALIPGCSSFVKEENKHEVFKLEEQTFRPKVYEDTDNKGYPFEKLGFPEGEDIRLIVNFGDRWVKVYGYADTGEMARLKEKRYLILYMFEEDFPGKRFDRDYFKKKLYSVVEISESSMRQ